MTIPLSVEVLPVVCRQCPAWNKLLLVADAGQACQEVRDLLAELGCQVEMLSGGQDVVRRLQDLDSEAAVWVRRRPQAEDVEAIRALRRHSPRLPVIVVAQDLGSDTAIELMKAGASDLIVEPFAPDQFQALIRRSLKARQLMCEAVLLPLATERAVPACRLIGHSRPMQEVYKQIGLVAERDEPVLIIGETGTGKELVARAIFQHSGRRAQPFLAVNCAALPENLLESELFGYEKGAFTGAVLRRLGMFEQAHRGTIFLDEIGDMPLYLQAKILRVAQTGEFFRLGGQESIAVDVRILAATHRNLEQMIEAGAFREDLYYRLNVVTLRLPPLRDHAEDILDLAEYFIARYTPAGQPRPALSADALARLQNYAWPGNIRELENALRRALVAARGHAILSRDLPLDEGPCPSPDDLRPRIDDTLAAADPEAELVQVLERWLGQRTAGRSDAESDLLTQLDNKAIAAALRLTDGNQVQAAKCLGISRTTLRSHLKG